MAWAQDDVEDDVEDEEDESQGKSVGEEGEELMLATTPLVLSITSSAQLLIALIILKLDAGNIIQVDTSDAQSTMDR